jgi:putative aldouronate transport system substrate-binding protein
LEQKQAWTESIGTALTMPPLSLTADEQSEYADILATAEAYRNEMVINFIIGAEPLENFDSFRSEMENMGINDALALQQAALDRFNAR